MAEHEEELAWERRLATPVAICAVLAAICLVQSAFVIAALSENRPNLEPTPDYLLSLDESPGGFVATTAVQALGALLLIPVFWYLFRATRYRGPELPDMFKYLVIAGPVIYAASQIVGLLSRMDVADTFAAGMPVAGDAGKERADDLLNDAGGLSIGLAFAGTLSLAFVYVMVPLRASRVGLISRFMGILGVVCGALLVLPLVPQALIQLFWLISLAMVLLNRWPGGRGPAWDTGEPEPWPTGQRGLMAPRPAADGEAPEEPDETPQRRSRKRK